MQPRLVFKLKRKSYCNKEKKHKKVTLDHLSYLVHDFFSLQSAKGLLRQHSTRQVSFSRNSDYKKIKVSKLLCKQFFVLSDIKEWHLLMFFFSRRHKVLEYSRYEITLHLNATFSLKGCPMIEGIICIQELASHGHQSYLPVSFFFLFYTTLISFHTPVCLPQLFPLNLRHFLLPFTISALLLFLLSLH